MMTTRKFKIEFSLLADQRSVKSEEGFLIQSFHDGEAWVWLKNSSKVTLRKGSVTQSFIDKLNSGSDLVCAGYKICILCEQSVPQAAPQKECVLAHPLQIKPPDDKEPCDQISTNATKSSLASQKAFLDPVLLRSMHSYQVEAASFLLNRLQDGPCSAGTASDKAHHLNKGLPLTGAILADDMGTGKTLVGLSVIWALCRHGRGKGVIVCPSSLIQNWRKEINKWLPKTARSTLYITGQGGGGGRLNDLNVHAFVSSPASVHPLLVISYDMFRIYAEAFNTVVTLGTLLCDEGHRLKNSVGTKTSLSLGNCIAMQRLVLTGTPLQNNLEELYAVVNFTVPGYLGTLEDFQHRFGRVIAAGQDPRAETGVRVEAESARCALSKLLQTILIRRTGDTLLRELLPPRREFIVAVTMQGEQQKRYINIARGLLKGEVDDRGGGTQTDLSGRRRKRPVGAGESGTLVLPGLQRLRVLCSSGEGEEDNAVTPSNEDEGPSKKEKGDHSQETHSCPPRGVADIIADSAKLHVLYSILLYMKQAPLRRDKLVIASNFIQTLDAIEPIVRAAGHQFLRIDGGVASDKRQSIVDLFNNENSVFSVCLISVKAGGVGLNLIGANRLVLFEPDYNPATDKQAIGRVWRVGQRKEVAIYRLVCASTIEESIVARQRHKTLLSSVITESDSGDKRKGNRKESAPDDSFKAAAKGVGVAVEPPALEVALSTQAPGVLKELILPDGHDLNLCASDDGVSDGVSGDEVQKPSSSSRVMTGDDPVLQRLVADPLVRCNVRIQQM